MPISSVEGVKETAVTGGIGLFGGSAYYLYLVNKGQQFIMSKFFINLFLAFFIGYVVGQFLDDKTSYRDGILAISGFASFHILDLFEKKGIIFMQKYIK